MRKPVVQAETELHEWTEGDQAAFEDEQLRAQDDDRPRREVSVKRVPTPPASERGPGPERGALGLPEPVGLMAEAQALALTDWTAMDPGERGRAIPVLLRRDVLSKWNAGRALLAHWEYLGQKQDRVAYLNRIGLPRTTAFRVMKLARLDVFQVGTCANEQAALEAVDAMEKPEPAPVVQPEPNDPPAREPDEVLPAEPDPETLIEDVAREAEPDREAEREAAAERLAIRLQDEDGPAVDVLHRKLEATEGRERDERRGRLKAERERDAMKRALLKAPDERAAVADALAVLGIARREAA